MTKKWRIHAVISHSSQKFMTSRNLPPAGTDKSSPEFATFIAAGMDSSILGKIFEGRVEENLFRDKRRRGSNRCCWMFSVSISFVGKHLSINN
jgi:hypothetical protein